MEQQSRQPGCNYDQAAGKLAERQPLTRSRAANTQGKGNGKNCRGKRWQNTMKRVSRRRKKKKKEITK